MQPAPEPDALHVVTVAEVRADEEPGMAWMIESLWARNAVGILGGAPKSCKSWLALEMAIAVASGKPCLDRFAVARPGPVLIACAEEPPLEVRRRIESLASARSIPFASLDIRLIVEPVLRLDQLRDRQRLTETLAEHRPAFLIIDPFIRFHRIDENSSADVSGLLAYLRELQRRFELAILVVHHTRKGWSESAGQALRGSSDFHAWGDSNLYLRRRKEQLILTMEHRCASSPDPIPLELDVQDSPHLRVVGETPTAGIDDELDERIRALITQAGQALPQGKLRDALRVRNQTLTSVLHQLERRGELARTAGGWTLPWLAENGTSPGAVPFPL